MKFLLNRLREPSTWAGIAAVVFAGSSATEIHPSLTPDFLGAVVATVAGVIAIVKRSPNGEE